MFPLGIRRLRRSGGPAARTPCAGSSIDYYHRLNTFTLEILQAHGFGMSRLRKSSHEPRAQLCPAEGVSHAQVLDNA
ncbi:MAG: hypothetical protein JO100_05385 [Pseudonocardia sp.]|nr:hypothetical protein [Pseudonocardia sp.]